MTLQILETKISQHRIQMTLADHADFEKATEIVDLTIPISDKLNLPNPYSGEEIALGELTTQQFGAVQLAALRYVRDAIVVETRRLAGLVRT